jgi:2-methylcitrate dehydratase PrpD
LRILEDPRGFWRHFAFAGLPGMLDDLGKFWLMETLSIKTFPGCHYFQTACTATERLLDRGPIALDDITRIDVDTNKLVLAVSQVGQSYAGEGFTSVNVNFDVASTLAVQLCAGRLTTEEMHQAWLDENRDKLRAWREKIFLRHAPALTMAVIGNGRALESSIRAYAQLGLKEWRQIYRGYRQQVLRGRASLGEILAWIPAIIRGRPPRPPVVGSAIPLVFPSRVTVHFRDGRRLQERVDVPVGSFCFPEMEERLREKFVDAVGRHKPDADALFARGLVPYDLETFIAAVSQR